MYADPYWCAVCDVTFNSEKASYEHDVSEAHHRLYEEHQKSWGRPTIHYCSVCDRGGISSIASWLSHAHGKPHKKAMEQFKQFYKMHREKTGDLKETSGQKSSSAPKHGKSTVNKGKPPSSSTAKRNNSASSNIKRRESKVVHQSFAPRAPQKIDVCEQSPISKPPDSSPVVRQDSSSKQEGLMLNILEAIEPQPSKASTAPPEQTSTKHTSKKTSGVSQKLIHCKRKTESDKLEPCSKRTIRSPEISHFEPNKTTTGITPSLIEPHEPGSVGDVKNMQEALAISQELEILKQTQTSLELQLNDIQTQLNEVKAKRKKLQIQRSNLLRGLVHSESDEENNIAISLTSTPGQSNSQFRPPITAGFPAVASVNPIQSTNIPPVQSSQQWPTSTSSSFAPMEVQKPPPPPPPPSSTQPVPKGFPSLFPTQPSTGFAHVEPLRHPAVSPSHLPTTQSCETPFSAYSTDAPSKPLNNSVSSSVPMNPTISASTDPAITPPLAPESGPSTVAGPPGVDLERLALIRQALQSPDSWQFTFEDVDQMLQQAAAKANAKRQTQNVASAQNHSVPSAQPSQPTPASGSHPPIVHPNPVFKTHIHVKGEPMVHAPTAPLEAQVLKPAADASSSSSFDSSEDERINQCPPVHKVKRLIKSDPTQPVSAESSTPATQTISHSTTVSSPAPEPSTVLKDLMKYGEFHAFESQTTAVTDMVVHQSSWSIFIGSQSGRVSQFDLKTHVCIRQFFPRDASVTQMALEPSEHSLFVGYYDNYFAEYNTGTGTVLFEKHFAQRIEAIAVPPLRDVSFLYLGMSNGDILRHDIQTRSVSLLYDRSLDSTVAETGIDAGISSLIVVQSGTRLLLIVGDQGHNLKVHAASDGTNLLHIRSAPHKGPPQGIAKLPVGTLFCAYSERAVRIHNWKTGTGVMTLQTQKITSSCVTERYLALGDSEGAVRVHKFQHNGLPQNRPMKVYFAATRAAITSLIGFSEALIAGGLDGSVTTIWVNEPAKNHICLYGPFGHNCGIGFANREDLVKHVLDTHFIFGGNKSIMCRWGAGRCRVRFSDTKSIKAISDHLLTHMPD